MSYTVYTEECGNLTIKIVHDEDAVNPFKEYDGNPDIIGWHRNYDFNTRKEDRNQDAESFLAEAKEKGYVIKPLYMYEHSGIAFKSGPFSCPWDSGQFGFIFWTPEKRKELGLTAEYISSLLQAGETIETWLDNQLASNIKLLNDYAQGNVYGFLVEDEDGEHVDSCYGFYGDYEDDSGCLEEARINAFSAVKRIVDEQAQAKRDLALTLGINEAEPCHI